jgi:hypothetical protein
VKKGKPSPPRRGTSRSWFRRLPARTIACLAAVFTIKLFVLVELTDHPLLKPEPGLDPALFLQLASDVASGNTWLAPGLFFVSPLYVYFLAAVLTLSAGSLDAVRLLQIGLGTFAVLVTFRLADLWHGRRAAWIAALLAVLTGTFTFYEVVLLSSALDPVLTAVALWCASGRPAALVAHRGDRARRPRHEPSQRAAGRRRDGPASRPHASLAPEPGRGERSPARATPAAHPQLRG